MRADEEQEEERFRNAIARSWRAVFAIGWHLHQRGNLWVLIAPMVVRPDFASRAGYGDVADLSVCKIGGKKWRPVEVKGRALAFTSREEYPFETIFVDRSEKADVAEPYAYFILNSSLSCAALIRGSTKQSWSGPTTYPDSVKGYSVRVYECPKELAEFITLR